MTMAVEIMRVALGVFLWAAFVWTAYKYACSLDALKDKDREIAKLKERQLELMEAGAQAVTAWYELSGSHVDHAKVKEISEDLSFGACYSVFYTDKPYRPTGKIALDIYNKQRKRYGYEPYDPQARSNPSNT